MVASLGSRLPASRGRCTETLGRREIPDHDDHADDNDDCDDDDEKSYLHQAVSIASPLSPGFAVK